MIPEMQIISDLQIHSKYARAVSTKMDLFEIARWASKKGIQLVATGDWTHPLWFEHIKQELVEVNSGIFALQNPPEDIKNPVFFMLSTEISSIYTQGGRGRRVHNLVFSPTLDACEKIIAQLEQRGANLRADGRPIVGISSKDLLELILEVDQSCMMIPAHAWTPWFGLYGSKSGFDSLHEAFGDLDKYIYAIETGLSSDPAMNWQIKELDNRSIVSFSDAHSGPKLGREATVFKFNDELKIKNDETKIHHSSFENHHLTRVDYSYLDIIGAIQQNPKSKVSLGYTIEFFPEEGKYHWSGHREHNVRLNPEEVKEKGSTCPVCKQPLTIGVENRVLDLADRTTRPNDLLHVKNSKGVTFVGDNNKKRRPFVSLVPLLEALQEISGSKTRAEREYERLVTTFAPEFSILLEKSYDEIEQAGGAQLREAIQRMRERKVVVDPGYDGVFGTVKLFDHTQEAQASLFER